jgi:hypothetical protein
VDDREFDRLTTLGSEGTQDPHDPLGLRGRVHLFERVIITRTRAIGTRRIERYLIGCSSDASDLINDASSRDHGNKGIL